MESVLYSISFGKQTDNGTRTKYQAFSAAISNQNHVDLVLSYIGQRRGSQQAKTCIVAYRLTNSDGDPDQSYVLEGFDDSNEEGSGQKLLSLLQKMSVENIMIVVYLWHQRMPGGNSCEVYRNVLERAKDLLTTLHTKVIEAESMLQRRIEEQQKSALALPPPTQSPHR